MILAHVMGIPVEESILQLAPAGAAMVTAVAIAGRASLGRLRRRLRHRSPNSGTADTLDSDFTGPTRRTPDVAFPADGSIDHLDAGFIPIFND